MSIKFLVIGAGRTGSTLLISTLNNLEGICCHGELLQTKLVRGYRDGFDPVRATANERESRARRLLRERSDNPVRFVTEALSSTYSATGFKALYNQYLNPDFLSVRQSLLSAPDMKYIHLERKNSLRRYVSQMVAAKGGAIHSAFGGRGEARIEVHINVEEFVLTAAKIETQRRQVCALLSGREVFSISYEELAEDIGTAVTRICHFLGVTVDTSNIQPALSKVGSVDLSTVISNYQELIDHPLTREFVFQA